jgi:hypothetical protein
MGKHQVIGVIEMEPCPHGGQADDRNVGETLRRLRQAPDSDELDILAWEVVELTNTEDAVVSATLEADLDQLHADLESEFNRFIERLVVAS